MKIRGIVSGRKIILLLLINLLVFAASAFSQENIVKPTRQSALDFFSKGNFEKAFIQFKELSSNYPKDPLYKYYCGVTLVNLEKDPVLASSYLREALKGSAVVRTIPADAPFYLGRAQQMCGNFSEAIKSYDQFTEQVGKKAARELSVNQLIQQCNEKKGELISPVREITADTVAPKKNTKNIKAQTVPKHEPDSALILKPALPVGYEKLLNNGLTYQFRADSLREISDSLKRIPGNEPVADKQKTKSLISSLEQLILVNQKLADESLTAAENMIHPKKVADPVLNVKLLPDTINQEKSIKQVMQQSIPVSGIDSSSTKMDKIIPGNIIQNPDNQIIKNTDNQAVTKESPGATKQNLVEVFSVFEILTNPVYSVDEKIPVNPDVEPGLIYRIQVAVFKNPVAAYYFKGITPLYGFKSEGSEVTKYYAGIFRKQLDASKALTRIKTAGFKDAIIVALLDKKVVSSERAANLEKEWGKKPFTGINYNVSDKQRDTDPSTLVFRVEVLKSPKPIPDDQLDKIKKLAGNRGLEILLNATQQYVYLIGKFLTFESAAEYADLLVRNGQKETKVTAYLGRREIPVETAKQLFEKL